MARPVVSALLVSALAILPVAAQQRGPRPAAPPAAPSAAAPAPAPAPAPPEPPAPAYEPQLLQLAEILGALTFLSDLCRDGVSPEAAQASEMWRTKMRELIDVETTTTGQKERYAGAFNRGFLGYQTTYRACTASGRLALQRLTADGVQLAHELSSRFGS